MRVSKLDETILKHCQKLKAISRHGVGYDNVDLNYIKKNKKSLLDTATANAVAVAEHVISMFLALSKSLEIYDKEVREGKFKTNATKIKTIEMLNKLGKESMVYSKKVVRIDVGDTVFWKSTNPGHMLSL